jgi:hypothetical protein
LAQRFEVRGRQLQQAETMASTDVVTQRVEAAVFRQ